uniref:hypothetical protein n=1 Tax=uncultured Dysgonomonas sp. TaxID=206096 RepID=UPI002631F29B|nr:hypothetical protein [uncultured Dysgonomonas sp.]
MSIVLIISLSVISVIAFTAICLLLRLIKELLKSLTLQHKINERLEIRIKHPMESALEIIKQKQEEMNP